MLRGWRGSEAWKLHMRVEDMQARAKDAARRKPRGDALTMYEVTLGQVQVMPTHRFKLYWDRICLIKRRLCIGSFITNYLVLVPAFRFRSNFHLANLHCPPLTNSYTGAFTKMISLEYIYSDSAMTSRLLTQHLTHHFPISGVTTSVTSQNLRCSSLLVRRCLDEK